MARVYLDSCIVIYLVQAPDSIRDSVSLTLLGGSPDSGPLAYVSDLTRLECRVWPLREKADELLAAFERFFASRDLCFATLDTAVFDLATELRADYGLKTPDALHIAAAIRSHCDEVWTNDHRIPRALEERIAIRIVP